MSKSIIKKLAILIFSIPFATITIGAHFSAVAKSVDPNTLLFDVNSWKGEEVKIPESAKHELVQKALENVDNLPDIGLEEAVGMAIKTVLRWSFFLTLISLVMASIYYIISMGKEEDVTKAKDIIMYLVIGMTIIAAAYGVISGISRFNFFSAEVDDQIQQHEEATN